jgi:hypothetical protein
MIKYPFVKEMSTLSPMKDKVSQIEPKVVKNMNPNYVVAFQVQDIYMNMPKI